MKIKQRIADMEGEQIRLYPNAVWTRLGYVLLVLFTVISLCFLLISGLFNVLSVSVLLITIAVVVLPFFYIGSRHISLDTPTKTVRFITLFGAGKAYRFNELSGVAYVKVDNLYDPVEQGYYRLSMAHDAYHAGIKLTAVHHVTAPVFIDFKKNIVPRIQSLLTKERVALSTSATKIEFTQFTRVGPVYTSTSFRYLNLILAVGFSLLFIAYFLGSDVSFEKDPPFYLLMLFVSLAAIGVNAALWGQRVTIDTAQRVIRPSYFGLFGRLYTVDEVKSISLVKHLSWGTYHNGTDVYIRLRNTTAPGDALLFYRLRGEKRIRLLVEEINQLLATPKPPQ